MGYIYIITNLVNNKKYIGKRKLPQGKIIETDSYFGSGKLLKLAIKKYGKNNFVKEILCTCASEEELNEKEKYWIDFYNAVDSKEFYNIHIGGEGGNTIKGWSKDRLKQHKIKMSTLTKGRNNGMYGRKHKEETKIKIKLNKSYDTYKTQEFREKMSKITQGENNGMYGRSHSISSIQKMSINQTGKHIGDKNGMFGKSGEKAVNSTKVYMYNDQKELVRTFNSVGLVLDFLGIKSHSALYKACREKQKYKGYYWEKEYRQK